MESDEQAVRAAHSTWIDAVNAGDLARLLTLITDDLLLINPGGAPMGREEFAAKFSSAKQEARFRCISELQDVAVIGGEVAYTVARDSLTMTPIAGGDTKHFAGHRLTVYRKHSDGRWLLARDAHTLAPVAK
jgi:uncharacterized protein (TIGR02246 family)